MEYFQRQRHLLIEAKIQITIEQLKHYNGKKNKNKNN